MLSGRIDVIYGPMFSGKSRELIRRLGEAAGRGIPTQAFKSNLDARHHPSDLTSHDGARFPATPVARVEAIVPAAGPPGTVGIDEVQFFPEGIVTRCADLRQQGFHVIAAGLLEDYRGAPFHVVASLMEAADAATALAARCARCGAEAHHTFRTAPETARVVVGAAESYEPRCDRCFRSGGTRHNQGPAYVE